MMSSKEYLSEMLSILCAYITVLRLKNTGELSDDDMSLLVQAQGVLVPLRDRFCKEVAHDE